MWNRKGRRRKPASVNVSVCVTLRVYLRPSSLSRSAFSNSIGLWTRLAFCLWIYPLFLSDQQRELELLKCDHKAAMRELAQHREESTKLRKIIADLVTEQARQSIREAR